MSLQQLKKDDLIALAENVDIEVTEDITKKELLAAFSDAGITYDTYKKFMIENDISAKPLEEKDVLLKMDRKNGSFEAYGVNFTREHPFAIVSAHLAQDIIDSYEGFRVANPAEAKSFYE